MATLSKGKTFSTNETVTNTKLHQLVDNGTVGAIQTADISDAQITAAKLAASAVETAKIKDVNVTTGKIADDAITADKLAILTTKGDVLGYSTEPTRIAVGANDTVLTADSTLATGAGFKTFNSGKVLQVVNTTLATFATSTGSPGNIPDDDTIPQTTETFIFSGLDRAITPTAGSTLYIDAVINFTGSATGEYAVCLFNADSHATNALAMGIIRTAANDTWSAPVGINFTQAEPNSGSATTYRIGIAQVGGSGEVDLNGKTGARAFGGALSSSVTITEIAA